MNRIAIINSSTKNVGIGHYSCDLSNILNAKLYTLVYDKKNDLYPGEKIYSFIPKIPGNYTFNIKFQNILFRKFINKIQKNNFIHYSSQEVKPFNSIDSSVTVHDLLGIENKSRIIGDNFKIYKKFKNVICVSNHIKNKLIDYGFEGNINVIYSGIKNVSHIDDKINLRKILNLPLDKKLILSVSDNNPRKNLKFLNDLFNNLGEEYKLVRVGPKVGDSTTFNNVDDETLNYIYNACDLMVYPSLEEGFGYPMAEAFCAGLPVVASNIDIFNEIGGGAAELCDININDFKNGIKNVLNNIDFYIKKSMDRSKIFDWDLYKSNVIKYFNKLLNQ